MTKITTLALTFALFASAACGGAPTAPESTTAGASTPVAVGTSGTLPPTTPAPTPAPSPSPSPAPTVAACSVQQPPAPGRAKMLICVINPDHEAIDHAQIWWLGVSQGWTDGNGQYLLDVRGYGGSGQLVVTHEDYRTALVDVGLHEDTVAVTVTLGR